jgi:hypothetical protein
MADRASLQLIGLVMASLTASVILIAAVLVYKSAGIMLTDRVTAPALLMLA